MPLGFVKKIVPEKNFGFISAGLDEPDVFFHASAAGPELFEQLKPGQPVVYELDDDPERRGQGMRAKSIKRCTPDQVIQTGPLAPARHHPKAQRKKPTWRR